MKAEDNQFPYLTLAEGATPPATPGAGLVRAYVDADDGRLYLVDDTGVAHPVAFTTDPAAAGALGDLTDVDTTGATAGQVLGTTDGATWGPVTPSGGSGSGGGILASTSYYPASAALYAPTTSMTDVDAVNAAVTFTAPDSGIVIVRATFGIVSDAQQSGMHISLREGTTELPSTRNRVGYGLAGRQDTAHCAWRITGLTPGSQHTYKLGFMGYGNSAGNTKIFVGGTAASDSWGPLVIEVAAA